MASVACQTMFDPPSGLVGFANYLWDQLKGEVFEFPLDVRKGNCFTYIIPNPIAIYVLQTHWEYLQTQLCQGLELRWIQDRVYVWKIGITIIYDLSPGDITNDYAKSKYDQVMKAVSQRRLKDEIEKKRESRVPLEPDDDCTCCSCCVIS